MARERARQSLSTLLRENRELLNPDSAPHILALFRASDRDRRLVYEVARWIESNPSSSAALQLEDVEEVVREAHCEDVLES